MLLVLLFQNGIKTHLVCPAIDERRQKLIDEIAMGGMKLQYSE
jgi:hypothetical protein